MHAACILATSFLTSGASPFKSRAGCISHITVLMAAAETRTDAATAPAEAGWLTKKQRRRRGDMRPSRQPMLRLSSACSNERAGRIVGTNKCHNRGGRLVLSKSYPVANKIPRNASHQVLGDRFRA